MKGLQAAFVTLLKANLENPGFEVTESNDEQEIIIKTPSDNRAALINKLQEIFKSQGHTIEHIPFQLQPVSANGANTERVDQFPKVEFPLVDIQNLNGNAIFERLFNEEIRKSTGNMSWQAAVGQNGQTVYYYVCQSEIDTNLRKAQVDVFKSILSHATLQDLYLALAKDSSKPLTVPNHPSIGSGPLTPHLENLFSVRKEEEGKFVVRFDCIGLVKCIISPQFFLGASSASMDVSTVTEIRVNKAHFMAYMSTLLNQGILLQEQGDRLYPIAFQGRFAIQQNTLIDFAIDSSGSMQAVFPYLKGVLVDVLREFPKILDPHATRVRISRFGSKTSNFSMFEFSLAELEQLVRQIYALPNPVDNEQTAIYQFLVKQYQNFRSLEDVNIVSVLISDGGDNDSAESYKPNDEQTDRLSMTLQSLEDMLSPPQFFSVEIGQLAELILEKIKQKTRGTRIQVGNGLENFNVFFNELKKLGLSRYFSQFVQQTRRFKLPFVDGQIIIAEPENYLLANEPFQINGVSYTAQRQDLSCRPSLVLQDEDEKKENKHSASAQREAENAELKNVMDRMQKLQTEMEELRRKNEEMQSKNQEMEKEITSLRDARTALLSSSQSPSVSSPSMLPSFEAQRQAEQKKSEHNNEDDNKPKPSDNGSWFSRCAVM